jgi:aminoglycoside phosphotransferase (APT) family kinase protein
VTRPAWTAEREITPAEARTLIGRRFPEIADAEVGFFAEGWDNTALRLRQPEAAEDLVFRFPRRSIALAGIRRELDWLPHLASLVPLPIPVPMFSGSWNRDRSDPWPFWGARMLAGTELAEAAPAAGERLYLAMALGEFLRALHAVDPERPRVAALPLDPNDRSDPARREERTLACLDRLQGNGLDAPLEAAAALVRRAAALPAASAAPVVSHGDLHPRHVLINGPDVTGIIDWGDLCVADPCVDLSLAFGTFEGPQRAAFLAAYGPIDGERELRARALAVSLNALLAEYALAQPATGASILPEVTAGIGRALAG